jgi:hypothetical protein
VGARALECRDASGVRRRRARVGSAAGTRPECRPVHQVCRRGRPGLAAGRGSGSSCHGGMGRSGAARGRLPGRHGPGGRDDRDGCRSRPGAGRPVGDPRRVLRGARRGPQRHGPRRRLGPGGGAGRAKRRSVGVRSADLDPRVRGRRRVARRLDLRRCGRLGERRGCGRRRSHDVHRRGRIWGRSRSRSRSRRGSRGRRRRACRSRRRRRGWGRLLGGRDGRRDGLGGRCRLWRGRRRRSRARGQEAERVDVAFLVGRAADAQVDARHRLLGRAARAHRPDRRTLAHLVAFRDADRAEMDEGHRIAVGGEDGDALTVGRERSGERDDTRRRRPDRRAFCARDVDAAVLAARVGVGPELERAKHVASRRPGPRTRLAAEDE